METQLMWWVEHRNWFQWPLIAWLVLYKFLFINVRYFSLLTPRKHLMQTKHVIQKHYIHHFMHFPVWKDRIHVVWKRQGHSISFEDQNRGVKDPRDIRESSLINSESCLATAAVWAPNILLLLKELKPRCKPTPQWHLFFINTLCYTRTAALEK